MNRHIIAISGGGFSEEENAFIDNYLLTIKRVERPIAIAFIPTASNDATGYVEKFHSAFQHELTSHLLIEDLSSPNIYEIVKQLDIIYIGGGNTQYMLDVWRKTGFDRVLIDAYHQGVIIAGISAGAMCLFDQCFSEKAGGTYEQFNGLNLLRGSFCPHYNDPTRKKMYDAWRVNKQNIPHYTLTDCENLHFCNEKLVAKIET